MAKTSLSHLLAFAAVLVAASAVMASQPQLITYQGYLTDNEGQPLDTTISMTFTIYDDSLTGVVWWTEDHGSVLVGDGIFSVLLGSQHPLPDTVFVGSRWLGIQAGIDPEMTPRARIGVVPTAMRVSTVDSAWGGTVIGGLQILGADTGLTALSGLPLQRDAYLTVGGSDYGGKIFVYDGAGNVPFRVDGVANGLVETHGELRLKAAGISPFGEIVLRVAGQEALWFDGSLFSWGFGGAENVLWDRTGIGTNDILSVLHVQQEDIQLSSASVHDDEIIVEGQIAALGLYSNDAGPVGSGIYLGEVTAAGGAFNKWSMYRQAGNTPELRFSFGTDKYPSRNPTLMRVTHEGRAICNGLEITGGADLCEPFTVNTDDDLIEGTLVIIDSEHPGQLTVSHLPYDRRVAGIVSGAGGVDPGITLSHKTMGKLGDNVALAGRVYCLADASFGSILPGDLLTTSPTPGHAMKVSDFPRAYGAVVGKAMTPLETGRGVVLVLVGLQ